MFAVSRTALREALQILSSRGLISIKKGSGIYVEDYCPTNVIKPMRLYLELNLDKAYLKYIIEVRKLLEPQIVRLAAIRRTDGDIAKMHKILDNLNKCPSNDFKKEGMLDRDFHLVLARASGNPMVPMILDPIFQLMPKIKLLIYCKITEAKISAEEYHLKIFNSIKDKNPEEAARAMEEHLQIAEEHASILEDEL